MRVLNKYRILLAMLILVILAFSYKLVLYKRHTWYNINHDDVETPVQSFIQKATSENQTEARNNDLNSLVEPHMGNGSFSNQTKHILLWNYYVHHVIGEGRGPFVDMGCPQTDCSITTNRTAMSDDKFDAIVFNGFNFPSAKDMPLLRNPHQRYLLLLIESPVNLVKARVNLPYQRVKNFFNWTMTYLRSSDIPKLYGSVVPKEVNVVNYLDLFPIWKNFSKNEVEEEHLLKKISSKKKLVAWFVSNCKQANRRLDYAKELKKYIPVDIYGKCGKLKCKKKSSQCYDMLERDYWFYLAFENSLCEDYVTEKFFNIMERKIVPIVYGGANYSLIAPPNSYIDVRDFKTPRELAIKLKELVKQPEEYVNFFWWKQYYKVINDGRSNKGAFCRLCQKLHASVSETKVYKDMEKWEGEKKRCFSTRNHPGMQWLP